MTDTLAQTRARLREHIATERPRSALLNWQAAHKSGNSLTRDAAFEDARAALEQKP